MELSIIRDGHRFPYSEAEFRRDNPNVMFPRGLVGVDFAQYGVIAEEAVHAAQPVQPIHHSQNMVAMHCFLYALRQFGLRVQFERYVQCIEGHARDYWMSCPYVARSSTYVRAMAEFFGLSDLDLAEIWQTAGSIEE